MTVEKPPLPPEKPMTRERMTAIREKMFLPMRSLAKLTERNESNIRAMEKGDRPIPEFVAEFLEDLDRWREAHPPPKKVHPSQRKSRLNTGEVENG